MDIWGRPKPPVPNPEEGATPPPDPNRPPEKTPAELIAEALKPVTDGFSEMRTRMQTLEEQTKPQPKPAPRPDEPVSILDDENLAFAQRLTPILARQFEMESTIVRDRILREYQNSGYGDLVGQFADEINTLLDSAPLVTADGKPFRGDPQYIRNVIDMVLGRKARAAGMRFDGKSKGFFLEPGSGSPNGGAEAPVEGISEGQRKVAERMGIPLDKAKDVIKKLHFV